jgi:hypothetical protein
VSGVDLVQWLTAALDDDERIARAAASLSGAMVRGSDRWRVSGSHTDDGGTYWSVTTTSPDLDRVPVVEMVGSGMSGGGAHTEEVAVHIVEHDPARVLREIDAKREIVRQHVPVGDGTVCLSYCHTRTPGEAQAWPCLTLRLLALPYSDRPGYRDEWKPSKLYRAGVPGVVDYEEAP